MVRRRSVSRKKSSRSGYVGTLGGPPARKNGGWLVLVLGALVVVNLYVFVWDKQTSVGAIKAKAEDPTMVIAARPLVTEAGSAAPIPAAVAPVAPPGTIDGKVGKTDTLGRVLKKSGLGATEANEVIRALTGVLDFKTIRQGQTYHLERGPDGHVKLFSLVVSKVHSVRAERAPSGELVGKADDSSTKVEDTAFGGTIESSLYAAIKATGENGSLVDFFVDVFAYDLDFYNDTHDGDQFRVVVEKETKSPDDPAQPAEFLRYRHILAAEYKGKAGTFRTYFWNGAYFDAEGESADKALLKTPLKFSRVSSGFDRSRMHPVLHTVKEHLGIDYAAPVGTPVWAAAAGTITQRGEAGAAGNLVMIKHANGLETAYMHLSKFADQKLGDKVEAKTVIGYVGQTGLATGPHLHFGVRVDGAYVDPSKLPPMHGTAVAAKDLDAFRAEVGKLDAMLAKITVAPVVVSKP